MKRRGLLILPAMLLAGCSASEGHRDAQPLPARPATATATPAPPQAAPAVASQVPLGLHDPAIAPLLSNLRYKPDPYETQPGCISEPKSRLRDELVLWAQLSLTRDASRGVAIKQASYSVTTLGVAPVDETAESAGIPRLALVHRDGSLSHSDFVGIYREPGSQEPRRSDQATPSDPTWVATWLANARVTNDIVAHRIVLDGRVLQEVKRPDESPRLSAIDCDDTQADGLKLSWRATHPNTQVPLRAQVLRFEDGAFVELLPSAAAREVHGFTVSSSDRQAPEDLVLLVTVTDTFRLVTRGVLIPRKVL